MEGRDKEGQGQEVQVGVHKYPFHFINIFLGEAWEVGRGVSWQQVT